MKLSNSCLIEFNRLNENLYCMEILLFLVWMLTLMHLHVKMLLFLNFCS
jgi:hypothetical protein